jgi:hypothetical protein
MEGEAWGYCFSEMQQAWVGLPEVGLSGKDVVEMMNYDSFQKQVPCNYMSWAVKCLEGHTYLTTAALRSCQIHLWWHSSVTLRLGESLLALDMGGEAYKRHTAKGQSIHESSHSWNSWYCQELLLSRSLEIAAQAHRPNLKQLSRQTFKNFHTSLKDQHQSGPKHLVHVT